MNDRIKQTVAWVAHTARLDVLVSRTLARRRAAILLYHDPTPELLEQHLDFLCRRHAPIPLELLVRAIETDNWTEIPPAAVVVTIDDGFSGNAALADTFRRHGVTPTIYLCSALAGTARRFWFQLPGLDPEPLKLLPDDQRLLQLAASHGFEPENEAGTDVPEALSREEIDAMADIVSFGSHTQTHPILPQCDALTAEREIRRSKDDLEDLLGHPCEHFAFPNGAYGERELELVRAAGYRSARTTDVGWNGAQDDPLRLRVVTRDADHMSVPLLALHLAGVAVVKESLQRARGRPQPQPHRTAHA